MPCQGTEEECRRRCIIDPTSCGGGPPGFAGTQREALTAELCDCKAGVTENQARVLAAHLMAHFTFAAKT